MHNDLISRSELKKAIENYLLKRQDILIWETDMLNMLDNAPTVAVNCKDCDGYEVGYSAGLKDAERLQDDIFPMKIVAGKCPIETDGNCPLKSQGEWVSVSEKLPEINVDVIVTDIETTGTYSAYYLGDGFWECDNGTHNNRIIAWMPFPEPYKKEDKKNETND